MLSLGSEFKFINRGFKKNMVLIPGWATDHRIFYNLNLNYNYLLPIRFRLFDFEKKLLQYLDKKSIDKVSLFGWSLGGFLATQFASRYPYRINELILLSVSKKFNFKDLKDIEIKLKKNKKAFLYKFYLECFSRTDLEGLNWFKKYLLNSYLEEISLEDLVLGLDYLSTVKINSKTLTKIKKIRIFHGKEDQIVSFKEALKIKYKLAQAEFISLPGIGHISFLNQKFKEAFNHG